MSTPTDKDEWLIVALAISTLFSFAGILDTCFFEPRRRKQREARLKSRLEQLAQQWRESERQMSQAGDDAEKDDS